MLTKKPAVPNLTTLLYEAINQVLRHLNCHQIGKVYSFDTTTQTATVEIMIKKIVDEDINGNKTFAEYPLLLDVPCVILGGGNGSLQFPISKDDECLIFFNDREIDNWFESGEKQAPTIKRVHDLSDGICLIGIRSLPNVLENYSDEAVKLIYTDTSLILTEGKSTLFAKNSIDIIANTDKIKMAAPILELNTHITTTLSGGLTMDVILRPKEVFAEKLHAENGVTGTFSTVTVENGIVVGGA